MQAPGVGVTAPANERTVDFAIAIDVPSKYSVNRILPDRLPMDVVCTCLDLERCHPLIHTSAGVFASNVASLGDHAANLLHCAGVHFVVPAHRR
jgi:hypothetical protein